MLQFNVLQYGMENVTVADGVVDVFNRICALARKVKVHDVSVGHTVHDMIIKLLAEHSDKLSPSTAAALRSLLDGGIARSIADSTITTSWLKRFSCCLK